MNKITINGKTFTGVGSVTVSNNRVMINGKSVDYGKAEDGILEVKVLEGTIEHLEADGSVVCNDVRGSVQAGGSVSCKSVGGTIQAGGSVNCGEVGGSVIAGGSVSYG